MPQVIKKKAMHPAERIATLLGVLLTALATGHAALRLPPVYATVAGAVVTALLGLALVPGERLVYLLEPNGLKAGKLLLPYREMASLRLVQLEGTLLCGGVVLPGYWAGKACSRRLGLFRLIGSTGLGQGLLISTTDGRRIVLTPAEPVRALLLLESLRTSANAHDDVRGRRPGRILAFRR